MSLLSTLFRVISTKFCPSNTRIFLQPVLHSLYRPSFAMSHGSQRSLNRLANAKSPYLLQHATNPVRSPLAYRVWPADFHAQVDWYEWGTEAFEKAKSEDKPIFLSVGYSACHCKLSRPRPSLEKLNAAQGAMFLPMRASRINISRT